MIFYFAVPRVISVKHSIIFVSIIIISFSLVVTASIIFLFLFGVFYRIYYFAIASAVDFLVFYGAWDVGDSPSFQIKGISTSEYILIFSPDAGNLPEYYWIAWISIAFFSLLGEIVERTGSSLDKYIDYLKERAGNR